MSNRVFKSLLVLVCVALAAFPVSAQSACASLATPTLSTTSASPGMNVGVFGKVTNCSSKKVRYTIVISARSSCGAETIIVSTRIAFNGGETKLISAPYSIASDTCLGTSTVIVSAYNGSTLLAATSTVLSIQ